MTELHSHEISYIKVKTSKAKDKQRRLLAEDEMKEANQSFYRLNPSHPQSEIVRETMTRRKHLIINLDLFLTSIRHKEHSIILSDLAPLNKLYRETTE